MNCGVFDFESRRSLSEFWFNKLRFEITNVISTQCIFVPRKIIYYTTCLRRSCLPRTVIGRYGSNEYKSLTW